MDIYVEIVMMHFRFGVPTYELASKYQHELKNYEHHTHGKCIKFTRVEDAVMAIIEGEKTAHRQAKNFEL
jgi:hypothetical protein